MKNTNYALLITLFALNGMQAIYAERNAPKKRLPIPEVFLKAAQDAEEKAIKEKIRAEQQKFDKQQSWLSKIRSQALKLHRMKQSDRGYAQEQAQLIDQINKARNEGILLKDQLNPLQVKNTNGSIEKIYLMHQAAEQGDKHLFSAILKHDVDVNKKFVSSHKTNAQIQNKSPQDILRAKLDKNTTRRKDYVDCLYELSKYRFEQFKKK